MAFQVAGITFNSLVYPFPMSVYTRSREWPLRKLGFSLFSPPHLVKPFNDSQLGMQFRVPHGGEGNVVDRMSEMCTSSERDLRDEPGDFIHVSK